jgi:hypothetical protein
VPALFPTLYDHRTDIMDVDTKRCEVCTYVARNAKRYLQHLTIKHPPGELWAAIGPHTHHIPAIRPRSRGGYEPWEKTKRRELVRDDQTCKTFGHVPENVFGYVTCAACGDRA